MSKQVESVTVSKDYYDWLNDRAFRVDELEEWRNEVTKNAVKRNAEYAKCREQNRQLERENAELTERVQELENAIKGSAVITNIASDEIAELESAHKMMHARNKRLEKENAKLTQLNANLWNKNENYVAVLRWIVNVGTDPRSVSKAKEILRRYGREEDERE